MTSETPDGVLEAAGHDRMRTLFVPLAPNPVMGGHVVAVSEDRIVDVEMAVEEGIQALVTSGVATTSRSYAKDISNGSQKHSPRRQLKRATGQSTTTTVLLVSCWIPRSMESGTTTSMELLRTGSSHPTNYVRQSRSLTECSKMEGPPSKR